MLSRLKNKFRRVSQGGASSNLDVNHMTSARSCDDVTRLDESNQLTYTEAIDTGVERRQRKVGRSAVGENGRWSDAIPGGVEKSLRGKRGSEESVMKERRRDRFRRLYHMYIRELLSNVSGRSWIICGCNVYLARLNVQNSNYAQLKIEDC